MTSLGESNTAIDPSPLLGSTQPEQRKSARKTLSVDSTNLYSSQHVDDAGSEKIPPRRLADFGSKLYWWGVFLAAIGVFFDGFVPGLNKFLETRSNVSGLQVTVIRVIFGLFFASIYVLPKHAKSEKGDPLVRPSWRHIFSYPYLWILIVFRFRNLSANYAPEFTLSYYVGILQLFVPLFTALGAKWFIGDKLPRYTYSAIIFVTIGVFLTVSGGEISGENSLDLHTIDALGIFLAILSAFGSAGDDVYFSFLDTSYSTVSLFWLTAVFELVMLLPISLSIDDWSIFGEFEVTDWLVLILGRVVAGYMIVDMTKIEAVRLVGAPLVATLQPMAGIVSLIFGTSKFIGEPVDMYGIIGACVVTVTVMIYVGIQYYDSTHIVEGDDDEDTYEKVDDTYLKDDLHNVTDEVDA